MWCHPKYSFCFPYKRTRHFKCGLLFHTKSRQIWWFIVIQNNLANLLSDGLDVRLIRKFILLCTSTQSLVSAKLFLLEEGLLVLVYFWHEEKQQFEYVSPHYFMHFRLFCLIWTFTSQERFQSHQVHQFHHD